LELSETTQVLKTSSSQEVLNEGVVYISFTGKLEENITSRLERSTCILSLSNLKKNLLCLSYLSCPTTAAFAVYRSINIGEVPKSRLKHVLTITPSSHPPPYPLPLLHPPPPLPPSPSSSFPLQPTASAAPCRRRAWLEGLSRHPTPATS
jgi:hypothetical protein